MREKRRHRLVLLLLLGLVLPGAAWAQTVLHEDDFHAGKLDGWSAYGADTIVTPLNGNPAVQTQGDSQVFWGAADDQSKRYRDVTIAGEVSVARSDAASGFLVRADTQAGGSGWSGYWAGIRRLSAGYAIVQLYRMPEGVLLQEARVRGAVEADQLIPLKVTCQGSSLWVWAGDMSAPAITEYDGTVAGPGFVGLKSEGSKASFDNIVISTPGPTLRAPLVRDWSGIKGAVFITSDSVNSYQMWEQYHPAVVDRELSYAHAYGLNTVEVYLDFLNWRKDSYLYLARIEDFLYRAENHGLKVTFIFFDDVGNVEPPHLAPYHAPLPGIHNSQMQGCPGRDILDNHYAEYRDALKAYVQGIVTAHKDDPRILFWQTYNEPSHAATLPLLADSYAWVKATGSAIPVTATGGGFFYGSYYSDFPSFHSYLDPKTGAPRTMVLGDGGPEHVCTETLDRPAVDVPKLVRYFAARKTGWVIWELMIGRDNCRFPWGSPPRAAEPRTPFHGLVYPDGHPWSLGDVKAIRGDNLSHLVLLRADYYGDSHFGTLKKTSRVPRLDFDLTAEPGTGASDASAGIGNTNWSIRYHGTLKPARSGRYTLSADSEGSVRVLLDGKLILSKPARSPRREVIIPGGPLYSSRSYALVVEYSHGSGAAHLHLAFSSDVPDWSPNLSIPLRYVR